MTLAEQIKTRVETLKAEAAKAKAAAASQAETGYKVCDGNFAKRMTMASGLGELMNELIEAGHLPVNATACKEAASRPGTAPVTIRLEKVMSLEEEREQVRIQKARLQAARDLKWAEKYCREPKVTKSALERFDTVAARLPKEWQDKVLAARVAAEQAKGAKKAPAKKKDETVVVNLKDEKPSEAAVLPTGIAAKLAAIRQGFARKTA